MLSDEERQVAIEEARNLNGVNPVVAIVGGLVGVTIATGLWFGTSSLGTFFALHPVDTDVYFIIRVTSVFRNIVMGLSSLASGFFGVTGVGILARPSGIWRRDGGIGSNANQEEKRRRE